MAYNFTLKCAEERLLSVRQIGCVVALEVLEEVLAQVHTAKDIMCKEDKVGAGIRHDRTKNIGDKQIILLDIILMWRGSSLWRRMLQGSNAEDVADLDQQALTIYAGCLIYRQQEVFWITSLISLSSAKFASYGK